METAGDPPEWRFLRQVGVSEWRRRWISHLVSTFHGMRGIRNYTVPSVSVTLFFVKLEPNSNSIHSCSSHRQNLPSLS